MSPAFTTPPVARGLAHVTFTCRPRSISMRATAPRSHSRPLQRHVTVAAVHQRPTHASLAVLLGFPAAGLSLPAFADQAAAEAVQAAQPVAAAVSNASEQAVERVTAAVPVASQAAAAVTDMQQAAAGKPSDAASTMGQAAADAAGTVQRAASDAAAALSGSDATSVVQAAADVDPTNIVFTMLFTIAVAALTLVTLGVAYLSFVSWNDSRVEAEDRRRQQSFQPSANGSKPAKKKVPAAKAQEEFKGFGKK